MIMSQYPGALSLPATSIARNSSADSSQPSSGKDRPKTFLTAMSTPPEAVMLDFPGRALLHRLCHPSFSSHSDAVGVCFVDCAADERGL